ncbi:hypothetical protein K505DRAFT_329436 [Melanomma pulvis-pyrius CBS 109.77]|uniref:Uncharacterized protein n=1 Tax=Melanomma pulvis-pyrius CBS 109.77 TaxID=1314802 RepID=A0A6A6WVL2_9PLEO|nr:hypothetical protein K505DRAFT_329436 [Melanomma pulvis-pyrius CBS 109.77]
MTVLNNISPEPIQDHDDATIYTTSTPPESVATGLSDENNSVQTIQIISSSVPWPGSRYVIRRAGSTHVITLFDGQVLLAPPGGRGAIYWECVEQKGWLGFKEPASGMLLGHNIHGQLCCTARRQNGWENFSARMKPDGGCVLLMTHWAELWPLGVRVDDGVETLLKVEVGVGDGLVWDFVKV